MPSTIVVLMGNACAVANYSSAGNDAQLAPAAVCWPITPQLSMMLSWLQLQCDGSGA